jgi:hypothetical protein
MHTEDGELSSRALQLCLRSHVMLSTCNSIESYELNFISEVPHRLVEMIAAAAVDSNVQVNVTKLFDVV